MPGAMFTRREVLKTAAVLGIASLLAGTTAITQPARTSWVYVGGYAGDGIRLFKLDPSTGELRDFGLAVEVTRPSFLTIAPSGKFLYSCLTIPGANNQRLYRVGAFAIDASSGKLNLLNDQPCGGENPCFIAIDSAGKTALVANYDSATVASLPIDSSGRLGEPISVMHQTGSGIVPQRQAHSYPHSINLDLQNRFAFAPDLGTDRVFVYRFDQPHGSLSPADPASIAVRPGSGPRHMAFHPNGKIVYLINELGNYLIVFAYDSDRGQLTELQSISTLPPDYTGPAQAAEVQLHPSTRFLFCSNRGPNNVTTFSIDPSSGKLARIGSHSTLGNWPRNFRIDPSGPYLIAANQRSHSIVLFRIGPDGMIEPVGKPWTVPQPSCVKFLAAEL
jgi:6-phosphogluconolactonase